MTHALPPVQIVQNAYVVADMELACLRMHDVYGIGPFLQIPRHTMVGVDLSGVPATEPIEIEVAFTQAGELNIELIYQHSNGPSAFRDSVPAGASGLHHVATFAADYHAARQAYLDRGYEVVMEMSGFGDYQICYVDTRPTLGHMLELYPDNAHLRNLYATIRERCVAWDGRELFEPLNN